MNRFPLLKMSSQRYPPPGGEMGQQGLERDDLLFRLVASIIDNDIDSWHGRLDPPPETAVGLIADEDLDSAGLVGAARRVNVDTNDLALGTEVVRPHL